MNCFCSDTTHQCTKCKKFICNFCSVPDISNEMHRICPSCSECQDELNNGSEQIPATDENKRKRMDVENTCDSNGVASLMLKLEEQARLIDGQKEIIERQSEEIEHQRQRNTFLRRRIEEAEERKEEVEKEKINLKERLEYELKKRVGIHMTNALGNRLDEGDYRTIIDNPKYKVLKHETENKIKGMIILNPSGVTLLKDKWGLSVNKNGDKRLKHDTLPQGDKEMIAGRMKDIQKLNNRILNLVLGYYHEPKTNESKPKLNLQNYLEKSRCGYNGNREHFRKLEVDLDLESDLVKQKIPHLEIFMGLKKTLDTVKAVTKDNY